MGESIWKGLLTLWLTYHFSIDVSRCIVYDVDGSFGVVASSLLAGPDGHRITYFPRFAESVSPETLGPLSQKSAPMATFYLAQNHCRATLQDALRKDDSSHGWLITLSTFDMWLESPSKPGTGIGDLLAQYTMASGRIPVALRIRDVQIGLNTSARRTRSKQTHC